MELEDNLYPADPHARYDLLERQLAAMLEDMPHRIAGLANAAALLNLALPGINWVGFYLRQGDRLILGPFQGKPACVEIPLGKGVCGTAAALGQPQRVGDVHSFPGHIACDSASRSELVLPLFKNGQVIGVLDIDSPHTNRFSPEDQAGLSRLLPLLEAIL